MNDTHWTGIRVRVCVKLALLAVASHGCLDERPVVASITINVAQTSLGLGQRTTVRALALDHQGIELADITRTLRVADPRGGVVRIGDNGRCPTGRPCELEGTGGGQALLVAEAGGSSTVRAQSSISVACPSTEGRTPVVKSGAITASGEWRAAEGPYRVTGDVVIQGEEVCTADQTSIGCVCQADKCSRPVTLTIGACTEIQLAAGARIVTGDGGRGQLRVMGSDSAEGRVKLLAESGAWGGIVLDGREPAPTSETKGRPSHSVIQNALLVRPGNSADGGAIVVKGGADTITRPALYNLEIQESASHGVLLSEHGRLNAGSARITIAGATTEPWRVHPRQVSQIPTDSGGSTYLGNATDAVLVDSGTTDRPIQFSLTALPYHIAGDLVIGSASGDAPLLSVLEGATLGFAAGAKLVIGPTEQLKARFRAAQSPEASARGQRSTPTPALFTSRVASAGAADHWGGLVLGPGSTEAFLWHLTIENAGAENGIRGWDGDYGTQDRGGLIIQKLGSILENVIVRNVSGYGVVRGFVHRGAADNAPSFTEALTSAPPVLVENAALGQESPANPLFMESGAVEQNAIQAQHFCDDGSGRPASPALSWKYGTDDAIAPAGSDQVQGFAVIATRVESVGGQTTESPYWTVYNIPKATRELPEQVQPGAISGATVGEYPQPAQFPCPADQQAWLRIEILAVDATVPTGEPNVPAWLAQHLLGRARLTAEYKP